MHFCLLENLLKFPYSFEWMCLRKYIDNYKSPNKLEKLSCLPAAAAAIQQMMEGSTSVKRVKNLFKTVEAALSSIYLLFVCLVILPSAALNSHSILAKLDEYGVRLPVSTNGHGSGSGGGFGGITILCCKQMAAVDHPRFRRRYKFHCFISVFVFIFILPENQR
jgi:hypothetical protein